MTFWLEVARWIIGISGASAVLIFVARRATEHLFSRDLERFRAQLQSSVAIELERHKAAFERATHEHGTRFSWLHAKKAEGLARLFEDIVRSTEATHQACTAVDVASRIGVEGHPFVVEPIAEMLRLRQQVNASYRALRVFLDSDVDDAVGEFLGVLGDAQNLVDAAGIWLDPEVPELPHLNQPSGDLAAAFAEDITPLEEALMVKLRDAFEVALGESSSLNGASEDGHLPESPARGSLEPPKGDTEGASS